MAIAETVRPAPGATRLDNYGIWFGPASRPLAGWITEPRAGTARSAVVIAPPTGYAYACSHRPLRRLAFELAQAGHAVLRFDYDGTGDSAGDQWDSGRVDAWRASLALAVAEMRERGAESVTVVGARLGATMALLEARALDVDRVVAWLPVARGRRYSKEVRLLSQTVPEGADPEGRPDTRVVAGTVFSRETTAAISALSLFDLDEPPARSVLVIDDAAGNATDSVERLRMLGAEVDHVMLAQAEEALETPPEYAVDSDDVVAVAVGWIDAAPAPEEPAPHDAGHDRPEASFAWRGGRVSEEFVELAGGRAGVLTRPADGVADPGAAVFVLLNPGAETHIGPGRAWVELARGLALAGRETLRVDMGGWGESHDPEASPGRPYDPDAVAETLAIADGLRRLGRRRIAIGGLCAGAWIGLDAARTGALDGVIAINPQLYWQQGDPVEIDWDLIRRERAAEIVIVENGARSGLWDRLAALGARNRVADWLQDLTDLPSRIELIFAERDDGVVYLEQRLGRRFAQLREGGEIGVQELVGVDHPLHLTWLRPRMLAAIEEALERIDARGTALARLTTAEPEGYERSELHAATRAYPESNCYTDVIIELLHARGLEPRAMLGHVVRIDFEGDQWTFFKPPPDDLQRLYGADIHEMQPYRPLPVQIAEQLTQDRTLIVELDSWFLPDTAGTSYRAEHVKSSVAAHAIDPAAETLQYFHGQSLYALSDEDYRGVFRIGAENPEVLPPYTELARFDAGEPLRGVALRAAAESLLAEHLRHAPTVNPFRAFGAHLLAQQDELLAGELADYHAYAFATVRMAGAAFELLGDHVAWLYGADAQDVLVPLGEIVDGCKALSFRMARRRPFDPAERIDALAGAWERALAQLRSRAG